MQDAKLDIDVDVKILKERFGQNFIIYNESCWFYFFTLLMPGSVLPFGIDCDICDKGKCLHVTNRVFSTQRQVLVLWQTDSLILT